MGFTGMACCAASGTPAAPGLEHVRQRLPAEPAQHLQVRMAGPKQHQVFASRPAHALLRLSQLLATPSKPNYIAPCSAFAPFVYRLGRQIFNLKRPVRLR